WLTGLQIRPEVSAVVHHALIYAMMPETADPLVAQFGLGQPFQCGGGLPPATQIHAWFPGTQPLQLPRGMALPLVPGTKIGVQLHYHPHGGVYDADHTAMDLQLSPDPPSRLFLAGMIGNETMAPRLLPGPGDTQDGVPEFIVPKNVPDHPEHMRIPLTGLGGMKVVSVLPHMHLLGTRLIVTLERGSPRRDEPSTECLANSSWNFDWQRNYAYDAAFDDLPTVDDDDIYDLQCTWNNTTSNPFMDRYLAETNQHEPVDVPFGEQTTNEMCLTIAGLATAAEDMSADSIRRIMARARGELGP
ncbi:MAG TPA: hypothetical protein VFT22_35380, partial [Kofleriaceae bacterium]|nr:hypothetical protein [Kofleriaceae bacterium]